jgi:hypothetical protein
MFSMLEGGLSRHKIADRLAEYVRCFNEKTIRGSCGDRRAALDERTATSFR